MDWVAALVGVVLGAGLSWLIGLDQTRRARRQAAGYLSRRIVFALDELILGIARVIDKAPDQYDDGQDYEYRWRTPERLVLPADGDWASLHTGDSEATMRLAVRVELAMEEVRVAAHFDSDMAYEVYDELFSRIGLDANELAGSLRRKYRIAGPESIGDWNPVDQLRTVRSKRAQLAAKRSAEEGATGQRANP